MNDYYEIFNRKVKHLKKLLFQCITFSHFKKHHMAIINLHVLLQISFLYLLMTALMVYLRSTNGYWQQKTKMDFSKEWDVVSICNEELLLVYVWYKTDWVYKIYVKANKKIKNHKLWYENCYMWKSGIQLVYEAKKLYKNTYQPIFLCITF